MQTNKTFPVDPVLRRRAEDEVGKNSRSACLSEMDVRALCHELEVNQVELQLQNEELQRITAELAASEKKYRDLYEFAPIGYLTVEPSGKIREANLAAATLLGTERAHLLNNLFQAYLAEDSLSKFNAFCSRVIASDSKEIAEVHLRSNGTKADVVGKKSWTEFIFKEDLKIMKKYHDLRRSDPSSVPRNYEFRLIDGLGKIRHIFMTIAMIPGTKQSVASLLDITERKTAEEKLKASLVEKELLLKEIHHRVKNNLQVVSSLLSLQSQSVKDKQTFDILQESQNRIKSMAMIHEKLYRSEDIAKTNFSEYIRSLSANLIRSYEAVSGGVRLDLNVEDINFGLDAAIPCGLIINELVSNSLKHAFPAGCKSCKGEITIEFLRIDDNKFKLSVSDNGIGFPKDKDFRQTESLGLQLVRILTDQLGGSIELDGSLGTKFIITFTENKI